MTTNNAFRTRQSLVVLVALAVVAVVALGFAAVGFRTATAQDSQTDAYWVVDIEPTSLKMIAPKKGVGAGGVYWYLVYDLVNTSGEDRDLYVGVAASTDDKRNYADVYLPGVERAAEKRERRGLWGKADLYQLLSKRDPTDPKYQYVTLKKGTRRACIAVFNRFDPNATNVRISFSGLTNEARSITREDGSKVLKTRLFELRYERIGDEFQITQDSFKFKGKSWVSKEVDLGAASSK